MIQTRIHLNTDYVYKEMERRGIKSVNGLARQIGISESMMNLMMREKRYPGRKTISLMKSYFNVNFETLFVEVLTKVHKSA
ncbi:helix-turn-helix domain-containing protein [Paenibacillus lutrae]|uniref:helix-turn-helix domain-containing protein n=1 Tax=Paenibacillus lutrae TaxID=2078573 RepID=UPI003B84AC83